MIPQRLQPPGFAPHHGRATPRVEILSTVARRIGLVAWDATRCRLSPGERILALILNLLTDRHPLYQVDDAFRAAARRGRHGGRCGR